MAKTDRSILTVNDQSFGQIADPNKLEASITHAYEKIDENDDEFIAHKKTVDPTSSDTVRDKHVSNNDLKILQDQIKSNDQDISSLQTDKANKIDVYTKAEVFSKNELQATTSGNSGATKIRTSAIGGLAGDNVQEMLENVNNKINQTVLGQIPDGSITPSKLNFDPATQEELVGHQADDVRHITAEERTVWNGKETPDGARKKVEQTDFKVYKSGKDSNGIFTTVEYKRQDDTLAVRAVLSGGTSPSYTTRTITYYGLNGTTVEKTSTRTLTYDTDGVLISEV